MSRPQQQSSKEEEEAFEFTPYRPSMLYPFMLKATSAYTSLVSHVDGFGADVQKRKGKLEEHKVTRWVALQAEKLRADKDLRTAALVGTGFFGFLFVVGKRPFLIGPAFGGACAWVGALAYYKPQVLTDEAKSAWHWLYTLTRSKPS